MTNFSITNLHPKLADFKSDVIEGLSQEQKRLLPIYFYDEEGSRLFDQICELDEYYPTRTEMKILTQNASAINDLISEPATIIEYGSGSSTKISSLLANSQKIKSYVPIDISLEHLKKSSLDLAENYRRLDVRAFCADYTDQDSLQNIANDDDGNSKIIFFPGSTIGILAVNDAIALLKNSRILTKGLGQFLLGIDLIKDQERLVAAYDDAQGVTAAFNKNILVRINRELGANFDLDGFSHEAIFNSELNRMEMHLRSLKDQKVELLGQEFTFTNGESIHTESCHKYSLDTFEQFVNKAQMTCQNIFTDENQDFAVVMLRYLDNDL